VLPTTGNPGTVITITGTNFLQGCTVLIGTLNATSTWISSTIVTASVPAGFFATSNVTVANPAPQMSLTNGLGYQVQGSFSMACRAGDPVGTTCNGGYKVNSTLVVQPSGCPQNSTNNPNCSGVDMATATYQWGLQGINTSLTNYASYPSVFNGASNTTTLVSSYGSLAIAASYCDNLVLNGYSDWYLPAGGELQAVYTNQSALHGGFEPSYPYYWTSNESDIGGAWIFNMSSAASFGDSKSYSGHVRCVRSY
jgi:hypothetical protein